MLLSTRRRGMSRGMGAATYNPEDCSVYGQDLVASYACVLRNGKAYQDWQNSPEQKQLATNALASQLLLTMQSGQSAADFLSREAANNPQIPSSAIVSAATGAAPAPPPAPAASTPARIAPGVVSISASQFTVGDPWTIRISGASPNQPVSAASSQNGQAHGSMNFGQTDANGNFSISGVMAADQIGHWSETWMVGGQVSGVLNFLVLQAPGASGTQSTTPTNYTNSPTPNVSSPAPGSPAPNTGSAADTTAGTVVYSPAAYATPTALTNFWSFLQQSAQIGSWSVPYWLLGVGGLGAVWAFRGHERGRR